MAGFRLLLSVSRARGAVELEGDDGRVWIWADLHLGDVDALTFFGRPFRSVDDMDHLLVERWQSVIGRNDFVVCLGDVTRGATSLPSLERLGGLPGRKVLVFGNHDRSAKGFDVVCGSVYTHGDPPLLLTHLPLRRVPPGCVNVHGHLHAGRVKGSTAHVNVSVEQIDYRPRRLTDIRRLAGVLARGRWLPGRTTAVIIFMAVANMPDEPAKKQEAQTSPPQSSPAVDPRRLLSGGGPDGKLGKTFSVGDHESGVFPGNRLVIAPDPRLEVGSKRLRGTAPGALPRSAGIPSSAVRRRNRRAPPRRRCRGHAKLPAWWPWR